MSDITPRSLMARLCRLQERVAAEAIGYADSNDCICGEGGFWSRGDTEWPEPDPLMWRNEGTAIDFIEQAVAEKIARERNDP